MDFFKVTYSKFWLRMIRKYNKNLKLILLNSDFGSHFRQEIGYCACVTVNLLVFLLR